MVKVVKGEGASASCDLPSSVCLYVCESCFLTYFFPVFFFQIYFYVGREGRRGL